jgi:hypothetical protein
MPAVFAAIEFATKVAADRPSGLAAAEFATRVAADWVGGLFETTAGVVAELPEAIGPDEVVVAELPETIGIDVVAVLPETNGADDEVSLDDEDVC